MFEKYFIFIFLFALNTGYAKCSPDCTIEGTTQEGCSSLNKISSVLSVITIETNTKLNAMDKKMDIFFKQCASEEKFTELKQNINSEMNALLSLENVVLEEVRQIRYGLSCKEQPLTGNYYVAPNHRIDDKSLHHVTFKKDSTGLSYLEMHLAVKGNKNAVILLSIRESPTNDDLQRDLSFGIYFSSNNISLQKTLVAVASANADGILSKTRFTPVYIKMNNGKLEIGKEGSSAPLLSFIDPDLRLVSHFSLGATDEATILYDCPTNIFQLIFNKP